jgi:molybdopterin synthase sulfur carrier subunit
MPEVRLFANLRNAAGIKTVSIKGASIREVVSGLVRQYPALAIYLLEDGQLRPQVIITKNGHPLEDLDTLLTEQDEIAIFPPVGGG